MSNSAKDAYLNEHMRTKHQGKASSFWMHDPEAIFQELNLIEGNTFLDAGCGLGDYSLFAAKAVGNSGTVYAMDRVEERILNLHEKAETQGLNNIMGIVADLIQPLPLEDECIDVCLMVTVLHTLNLDRIGESLFAEIDRVLKPAGHLVTIDCKSEDASFGPPMSMRIPPEQIEALAKKQGLQKVNSVDLGFNYLLHFKKRL